MGQGQSHPKTAFTQGHPSPPARHSPCRCRCRCRWRRGRGPVSVGQDAREGSIRASGLSCPLRGMKAAEQQGEDGPEVGRCLGPVATGRGVPGRPPAQGSGSWSTQKEACPLSWGSSGVQGSGAVCGGCCVQASLTPQCLSHGGTAALSDTDALTSPEPSRESIHCPSGIQPWSGAVSGMEGDRHCRPLAGSRGAPSMPWLLWVPSS